MPPVEILYLHQLTPPEIQESMLPVTDIQGRLWGGRDRKGYNAPHPRELWRQWQDECFKVQRGDYPGFTHANIPQHVHDYYQEHKSVGVAPPAKVIPIKAKRFSWSYTALSDFESCPFCYAEKRVYKRVEQEDTTYLDWGRRVHETAQCILEGKEYDEEVAPLVKPYCDTIRKAAIGGTLLVEQSLALTRELKPCKGTDWDIVWGRGVLDVTVIRGIKANIFDWKTGSVKDDQTQLKIFCAFLAQRYPDLQEFDAKFIWVKDKKITGLSKPLTRKDLLEVWKEILPRIRRMEQAWTSEIFQQLTSGLCKKHCPVFKCPHNNRKGPMPVIEPT